MVAAAQLSVCDGYVETNDELVGDGLACWEIRKRVVDMVCTLGTAQGAKANKASRYIYILWIQDTLSCT